MRGRGCEWEDAGREASRLPCQHQLPCLDPVFWIVVPRRTKLDILHSIFVRKYSLQAFVKLLSKGFDIFGGTEPRRF